MPPSQQGKICLAQRAGLLLWVAAQVMSASGLPGQPEARYHTWKPEAEARSVGDQPVRAFAPAAAVETLNSTLVAGGAKPEAPIELWLDAKPWAVHLPAGQPKEPLRGVLPPTWMLLGAASLVLATVDNRHHRRRTQTGCRHTTELAVRKRKPRSTPWVRESAAVSPLAIPRTAR